MPTTAIGPSPGRERVSALFVGTGVMAAQGLYFLFYAPLIAQAVNFRWMNTLWLKIHVNLCWTSYFLLFASLAFTVYLLLNRSSTRFPWVEGAMVAASIFAVISLIAGILFAKDAWGVYWVWDAKNTFVLLATPVLVGISLLAIVARAFLSATPRNIVLLALLSIAVGLCAGSFLVGFRLVMHPQVLIQTLFPR